MQNSELYRRGFVVPHNEAALTALLNNRADESTAVDFFEIPNQAVFDKLFNSGIFTAIRKETGALLGDYEETVIEYSLMLKLKSAVRTFKNGTTLDQDENHAVSMLYRLIDLAIERQTCLFFIL